MENTWQETLREAFADSFMKPEAYRGADIESEVLAEGLDLEPDGIYTRLSASGFLDCTDWAGPFPDAKTAAEYLMDTYAD
jgi:hypothetical protein